MIAIPVDLCSHKGYEVCELLLLFLVALIGNERLTGDMVKQELEHPCRDRTKYTVIGKEELTPTPALISLKF